MRFSPFLLFLSSTRLSRADEENQEVLHDDDGPTDTYFNSIKVPPMLELTPETYDKAVNEHRSIIIKHYSPYCPHCMDYAPLFQTLYEFYYTSTPVSSEHKTFTDYYDFHFAMVNCVAYYDLCASHNVSSYPNTILYKNGEQVEIIRGVKEIEEVSPHIEKVLEEYKPGTRPQKLRLPEAGDMFSPDKLPHKNGGSKKPAEVKPAEVKPAEEKPAEETPAEEKPTEEKPAEEKPGEAKTAEEKTDTKADENPPAKMSPKQELEALKKDSSEKPAQEANKAPSDTPSKEDARLVLKAPPAAKPPSQEVIKAGPKAPPAETPPKYVKNLPKAPAAKDGAIPAEKTDTKASNTQKSLVVPTMPVKKPFATPNKDGVSVPLTAEKFQTLVTMTQDLWFIKFYAPWCHHCRAMAPNWQQLAKEMQGRLNIGEVNCDAETRLCKDVRLRGYPTILLFKGGERVEYEGLRGLGDFTHFAEKAIDISEGVQDVTAKSLTLLEETEEVIFIYFYDHATTTEDFTALERIPLNLIGKAKLVKTKDPALCSRYKITTWPRLLVSREGRPTYYQPLTPKEMRDVPQVLNWMKSVWLPIIPEMTASNARDIMDGKLVVLGIINRQDQEGFVGAMRELKSAANEWMDKQILLFQHERQEMRDTKQLRIDEAEDRGDQRALRAAKATRINMDKSDRKQVSFAWVDRIFWQRWIRNTYGIDIRDGDRVIINDEDNRRYWDTTITGNNILLSRTSILETINKVITSPPKIKPKITVSSFEKIFFDMRVTLFEHPLLTLGCILGLAFGALSWLRSCARRGRGGHFRLEESWSNKELVREGLLGPNGNGKVD